MKVGAIIVAAGSGSRAGLVPPKQFAMIRNSPVLAYTLNCFTRHASIRECVAVIGEHHQEFYDSIVSPHLVGEVQVVTGGQSRTASVYNGLLSLKNSGISHVLIHDGVRPCVSPDLISRLVTALKTCDGVLPVQYIRDSVWKAENSRLVNSVPRPGLIRAQTPQGFAYERICSAYRNRSGIASDCAALAVEQGIDVLTVAGEDDNIKLTTQRDYYRIKRKLDKVIDIRTGQGIDIHEFCDGPSMVVCGKTIECGMALRGHSDADLGFHAIADAIYGALAEGDIGTWFPPNEEKWKDADSRVFLKHAQSLCSSRGYRVTSIDCTFVCERPKISSHAGEMRSNVAKVLEIDPERVSIKATTSEGLGFPGRNEGMVAFAIATLVGSCPQ